MRVLLTGHLGYLGGVAGPALRARGHDVTGLDSGLFSGCVLGPAPADVPGHAMDLRDVPPEVLDGFDAVVHLAALSNDPLGFLAPEITFEINHRASVQLAKLARDAGVSRFLYASTCSVYGTAGEDLVDERAPLRPVTPYAESKVRVEDDLLDLADDDFSPVFLRNATAFGFSPRLRADIVLNNLVAHGVLTGQVRVLSDGTPWRPLVHVEDIAAAFLAALEAPRDAVHARAFNVGLECNNLTVREIAQLVVRTVRGAELAIADRGSPDPRSYRVDFSSIRRSLPDFRPRWTAVAGARELRDQYLRYGLDRDGFDHRYNRLEHIAGKRRAGELTDELRWKV